MEVLLFFTMLVSFVLASIVMYNTKSLCTAFVYCMFLIFRSTCHHFDNEQLKICKTEFKNQKLK